jgi:hypothetical protein
VVKSTLYITAKVLPGNKLEIQSPSLSVGQTVEVIVLAQEISAQEISQSYLSTDLPIEEQALSPEQRIAFLKLPIVDRRRILERQAETALNHYQQNTEWQELMSGDIISY